MFQDKSFAADDELIIEFKKLSSKQVERNKYDMKRGSGMPFFYYYVRTF